MRCTVRNSSRDESVVEGDALRCGVGSNHVAPALGDGIGIGIRGPCMVAEKGRLPLLS